MCLCVFRCVTARCLRRLCSDLNMVWVLLSRSSFPSGRLSLEISSTERRSSLIPSSLEVILCPLWHWCHQQIHNHSHLSYIFGKKDLHSSDVKLLCPQVKPNGCCSVGWWSFYLMATMEPDLSTRPAIWSASSRSVGLNCRIHVKPNYLSDFWFCVNSVHINSCNFNWDFLTDLALNVMLLPENQTNTDASG